MADKPTAGTIVSFGNTPQARNDAFSGLGTEDTGSVIYLDVMANDLAGKGKSLWSTDDGVSAGGDRPVDLLTQDAVGAIGSTLLGAQIWITADGKIAYRMTDALRASLQSLAVGQTATDSFTYAIQMGNNGTLSWAQASFTVTGVNDVPVVQNVSLAAVEDGPAETGSFVGDDVDSDDDGGTLQYTLDLQPAVGTLTNNGNGTFTYDTGGKFQELAAGETTTQSFTYTAKDKHGAVSAPATGTITITGVNDAPTLKATTAAATEDGGAVTVDLSALGNDIDSDDDGSTLTYTLLNAPSAGSAAISGTTLSFNPGKDFQGLAQDETQVLTLNVEAKDKHGATALNTVTVTVTGVNDAPTLASGGSVSVIEDGAASTLDLATLGDDVDSDNDGANLKYSLLNNPAQGIAAIAGTVLSFSPDDDYQQLNQGMKVFVDVTVRATDNHGASVDNTVRLNVTGVNDAPTLAAGGAVYATEDGAASTLNLAALGDDVDFENDGTNLKYTLLSTPAQGTAGIAGTTLTFSPDDAYQELNAGQQVYVDVKVRATDNQGASAENTVRLYTTGVNDAPTLEAGALAAIEDGAAVTLNLAPLGDDIDFENDGSNLAYTLSGPPLPGGGTAAIAGTQLTFAPGTNYQALGEGEVSTFTQTIVATDKRGATATNTVTISVTGRNDAPVITSGTDQAKGNTKEDTDLSVSGTVSISDVDANDTHTWSIASNTSGAYGSATVDGAGKWTYTVNNGTNGVAGAVQSLAQGQTVIETFTVRASDGKGGNADQIVHVVVAGINDAAVIGTQSMALTETNAAQSTGGTLTLSDIDSPAQFNAQTLTGKYGSFSIGADGKWTYAMDGAHDEFEQGKNYVETFSATAVDGTTRADAVTITIAGTNDAPVAVNDVGALKVTSLASQVNTTTVKWVDWTQFGANQVKGVIDLGGGQTIDVTYSGAYSSAPVDNYYTTPPTVPGDFTFGTGTYTSSGVANGPTGTDIVILHAATTRTLSFSQPVDNLFFAIVSLNGNGYRFDQDFDILSYGRGYFGNGSAVKTALPDGRYELLSVNTPGRNELHGVIGIKGSVTSLTWDGLSNEYWNGFTVGTYGKAQTAVATGNLLANDSDPENNPINVASVNGQAIAGSSITLTLASNARLTVNKNGSFSYDENGAFVELAEGETFVDSFNYSDMDSLGAASNTATARITVTGINDAPIMASDMLLAVTEDGGASTLDLSEQAEDIDSDDDGTTLVYSLLSTPAQGSLTLSGSTLSFAPGTQYQELNRGQVVTTTVSVKATDRHGASTVEQVTLSITGVNDAPTLKTHTFAATEDGAPVTVNLATLGDDVDFENDGTNLKYALVNQPPPGQGSASLVGTTLSFAPGTGFQGLSQGEVQTVQFDVRATDKQNASVVQTLKANVTGINDAPTLQSGGTMTAQEDAGVITFNLAAIGNDVDSDDDGSTLVYSLQSPSPTQGTLTIDNVADTLVFTPNAGIQALGAGQSLPVDVLVRATDKHGAFTQNTVRLTLVGANDAPTMTGGDAAGAVTAQPGVAPFTVKQYTSYYSDDFSLAALQAFANANAPSYTATTTVIDYTDDPGGFAGEIPGSTPWPAAQQTGASGTGHSLNNDFFARIQGQVTITQADTYTFRTYNDDGVYLHVNNQLIINDPNQHGEQAFNGSIFLNPGVYPIDLFFFENGGEASLEFSFKNSTGSSFGHVTSGNLADSGVLNFADVDTIDGHTVTVAPVGGVLGSLTAAVTNAATGDGAGNVTWNYAVANNNPAITALGAGATRIEQFNVTVNDGKGGTATQQVSVTINGVNDGPKANSDSGSGNEDTPITIAVLANDTDPDTGDTLSIQAVTNGTNGTVAISGGNAVYTPKPNFNGTDSFSYTVKDAGGALSSANVTVTVNPVVDSYSSANLVANGSFESGSSSWTQLGGGIDVLTNNAWQAADGANTVDLNAFNKGGVKQTLATVPGETYSVSFMLSQNPGETGTSTVRVAASGFLGDYSFNQPNTTSNMMWEQKTFTFVATAASTELSFTSLTPVTAVGFPGDAQGPALDEVVAVANVVVNGFVKGNVNGDLVQLNALLTSINAPHDNSAFTGGFLQFQQVGGDTLVRIDPNGGGDNYLTAMTLVGVVLTSGDTASYVL